MTLQLIHLGCKKYSCYRQSVAAMSIQANIKRLVSMMWSHISNIMWSIQANIERLVSSSYDTLVDTFSTCLACLPSALSFLLSSPTLPNLYYFLHSLQLWVISTISTLLSIPAGNRQHSFVNFYGNIYGMTEIHNKICSKDFTLCKCIIKGKRFQ